MSASRERSGVFSSPSSSAPFNNIMPSWPRPCPPAGGSFLVRMERLVSSTLTRFVKGLCSGSTIAGRSVRGELPGAVARACRTLLLKRRDPVGTGRHQTGGPEPDGQWQRAGVQQCPGRHRRLPAAAGALEGTGLAARCPFLVMTVFGTGETVRPAHPDQPGGADPVVREQASDSEKAVRMRRQWRGSTGKERSWNIPGFTRRLDHNSQLLNTKTGGKAQGVRPGFHGEIITETSILLPHGKCYSSSTWKLDRYSGVVGIQN